MRSVSQILSGQPSYDQAIDGIHIAARLRVEAMQLDDSRIRWAARTMNKAADHICDLEETAGQVVIREIERVKQELRGQGHLTQDGDMPTFSPFGWLDEYKWLVNYANEKDIELAALCR